MEYNNVPDLRRQLADWSEDIELLRQNQLMRESQFLTFAKDRAVPVCGVISGEPGDFFKRGWLYADAIDGEPLFHPFRIFPLYRILRTCDVGIATAASLNPDSYLRLTTYALEHMWTAKRLGEVSRDWNTVVTLAVILEPIYWPRIVGSQRLAGGMRKEAHLELREKYCIRVSSLVQSLDPAFWRNVHECLRVDAAWMDDNSELYMLLRVATWDARKRLTGHVSGALWIRHMAEVIRRAFEVTHEQRWSEEYEAFGLWHGGARRRAFGSERPLDDMLAAKPYVAATFGLFTGCALRWYVEGDTEYFSVLEMLTDLSRFGVELVNLKGAIASGKGNVALKLEASLRADRLLRRFSMISFDRDVPENVKVIQRQLKQEHVVGFIAAHEPDFEFANFSGSELAEVAAKIDEAHGFPGAPVRDADWAGVASAAAFEAKYREFSARKASNLKGEDWGRALARFAIDHPNRPDGNLRPLWQELRMAVHAWSSNYDFQRDHFTFDGVNFELVRKPNSAKS